DNITVMAELGQDSAVVDYALPDVPNIISSPPSGSAFPVGTTEVNIIVIDASGDLATICTFTVTVNPAGPPLALACVSNFFVVVPTGQPAVVNYPLPSLNKPVGATLVCLPPPGYVFPVGTTTVTCTATNMLGETAACSFSVNVVQ